MGKTVGRLLISVRSLPLCDNLAALINELSMVLSMSCSPVYLGWSAVMHNGHIRGKLAPALNKLLISGCEISAFLGIDDRTPGWGDFLPENLVTLRAMTGGER